MWSSTFCVNKTVKQSLPSATIATADKLFYIALQYFAYRVHLYNILSQTLHYLPCNCKQILSSNRDVQLLRSNFFQVSGLEEITSRKSNIYFPREPVRSIGPRLISIVWILLGTFFYNQQYFHASNATKGKFRKQNQ